MKGSFSAIGYEELKPSSPVFFLPYVGLIQLALVLEFSVQGISHVLFEPFPLIGSLFPLSVTIFALSLILILGQRLFSQSPSTMTIEYLDLREGGGPLTLSYKTSSGKSRESLVVKKVEDFPGIPLERMEIAVLTRIRGSRASMRVSFSKPKVYLQLGFESDDQMHEAYQKLK